MRLKELRRDMRQADISEDTGISVPVISRLETGSALPSIGQAYVLAVYFRCEVWELYDNREIGFFKGIVSGAQKALKARKEYKRKQPCKLTVRTKRKVANAMRRQMRQYGLRTQADWLEFAVDAVDELYKEKSPVSNTAATVSETSDNPKMCIHSVSQEAR